MRAWQIESADGIDALRCVERESLELGHGEVRVAVKAASINYRDLATVKNPEARAIAYPRIPNSDASGEVVEVGPGVTNVAVGDRIAGCFFQRWEDGPCSALAMASALGGPIDGVLAEEAVLRADGVVPVPEHLSYAEAATLPCAALTAWNALVGVAGVKAGDTVLLLGTGGVSIFALQFATTLGARVIITSSSDDKLERAAGMGAWRTINYRTHPDWDREVLDLTDGAGADAVVEVGGAGTLPRSIASVKVAGTIALIGVLTGGETDPAAIMRKSIRLQGLYVGPRRMFREMNRAIEFHGIHPVIHEAFSFDDARAAFHAMASAAHFGKLVVAM